MRGLPKIFKVRVEFDEEMHMSDGVIAEYAGDCVRCARKKDCRRWTAGRSPRFLSMGCGRRAAE